MIMASTVFGGDYNRTGGEDLSFNQKGTGTFNPENDEQTVTAQKVLTDGEFHPLVADLDNDGVNEIIVFDGNQVELYHGSDMTLVDIQTMSTLDPLGYIYAITYDVDGDGYTEIIATSNFGAYGIEIMKYNSTHFYSMSDDTSPNFGSDCIFNCIETERCAYVCADSVTSASGSYTYGFDIGLFNSTDIYYATDSQRWTCGDQSGESCCVSHPAIPYLTISDIDGDSITEMIWSYRVEEYPHIGGSHKFFYEIVEIYENDTMGLQSAKGVDSGWDTGASATYNCRLLWGNRFTEVSVYDYDGAVGTGEEIVMGIMDTSSTYVMYNYNWDGTENHKHPFIVDKGDGNLVSNVIRMNSFPSSSTQDYCVYGFDEDSQELTALCGTLNPAFGYFSTQNFDFEMSGLNNPYNISDDARLFRKMGHASQSSSQLESGENLDEVFISYGVFSIDYDALSGEDLVLLYENPIGIDSAFIPIDVEQNDLDDVLIQTANNVYYLDDGFTNTYAFIDSDSCSINPCVDKVWKTNTSVLVNFRGNDVDDDDLIQGRAIMYYDEGNDTQDSGWSNLQSSPVDYSYEFIANKTKVAGKLYIMVRDAEENNRTFMVDLCNSPSSDIGCEVYTFNVQNTGTGEYPDACTTSCGTAEENISVTPPECVTDLDCDTGKECISGECETLVEVCTTTAECNNGYECVNNECLEIPEKGEDVVAGTVKYLSAFAGITTTMMVLLFLIIVLGAIFLSDISPDAKFFFAIMTIAVIIGGAVYDMLIDFIWLLILILFGIVAGAIMFARIFGRKAGD